MKRSDLIEKNFIEMKEEYLSSYNNSCRKIDAIFRNELRRFQTYLSEFNNQFHSLEESEFTVVNDYLKEIFNSYKVMLVDDYASKFNKNVELITKTMHDFFIKKLEKDNVRMPVEEINEYLKSMCNFDCFKISNGLEDKLNEFKKMFNYKYVNSDEAKEAIETQIRNVEYTLLCELKKIIASSIEDKQDITTRYNTRNKEVLNIEPSNSEK